MPIKKNKQVKNFDYAKLLLSKTIKELKAGLNDIEREIKYCHNWDSYIEVIRMIDDYELNILASVQLIDWNLFTKDFKKFSDEEKADTMIALHELANKKKMMLDLDKMPHHLTKYLKSKNKNPKK